MANLKSMIAKRNGDPKGSNKSTAKHIKDIKKHNKSVKTKGKAGKGKTSRLYM